MKLITLYVPEPYLEALDELIKTKFFPNRAEAIRLAIHDLISLQSPKQPKTTVNYRKEKLLGRIAEWKEPKIAK